MSGERPLGRPGERPPSDGRVERSQDPRDEGGPFGRGRPVSDQRGEREEHVHDVPGPEVLGNSAARMRLARALARVVKEMDQGDPVGGFRRLR